MSARASALSFFLLFFNYIFAQDNKLLIQGAIFAEDGKPVPYASISLVKEGLGTITNQSGRFALYIPAVPEDDHILVTMLGYEPQLVLLKAFKPASTLRITLKLQASQYRWSRRDLDNHRRP